MNDQRDRGPRDRRRRPGSRYDETRAAEREQIMVRAAEAGVVMSRLSDLSGLEPGWNVRTVIGRERSVSSFRVGVVRLQMQVFPVGKGNLLEVLGEGGVRLSVRYFDHIPDEGQLLAVALFVQYMSGLDGIGRLLDPVLSDLEVCSVSAHGTRAGDGRVPQRR